MCGSLPHVRNTTDYTRSVAANTRAALARHDKTQRWLATATGMKEPTLHNKLRGKSPFYVHEILWIAEVLGIDVRELMPPLADVAA